MSALGRRQLIQLLAASAAGLAAPAFAAGPAAAARVNALRLQQTLEALSVFGRPAGGAFADGVSRTAYSDADVAGRAYVIGLMTDAGLKPQIDAAGNITGRRAGSGKGLKPIILGSHIDSVPNGGNFDGDLGSLSAIEIVRTLNDRRIATRHPLEVTIWSNEEGGTIGSGCVLKVPSPETLNRKFNGVVMRDGLRKIGGDPDRLADAVRAPGSFKSYLELHIEQGGVLEQAGAAIGVVDGIVAKDDYEVEIRGFANHAGTTPMPQRRNALLAAARLIEAVQAIVTRDPGRQVGTVGRLDVFPNAPNVVPGLVRHSIDLRDMSDAKIAALGAEVTARAAQIAAQTDTEISIRLAAHVAGALADPALQAAIEAAAAGLALKSMHLPSGAGHDAQVLAKLGPMGMIFVPSIGGISHAPKELTPWADCANGADVLMGAMLAVDRAA